MPMLRLAGISLLCADAGAFMVGISAPAHSTANAVVMQVEFDGAEPPSRPSSVYSMLSDLQISQIHRPADALFSVVDRDGDGMVSKEELAAHLLAARYSEENIEELFGMIDANSDGSISNTELREVFVRYPPIRSAPAMGSLPKQKRAVVVEEADATFASIDTNGDGLLSLQELQEHLEGVEGPTYSASAVEKIFRTLDVNDDEQVTKAEFRNGYVRYRAMRLTLGLRLDFRAVERI